MVMLVERDAESWYYIPAPLIGLHFLYSYIVGRYRGDARCEDRNTTSLSPKR